MRRCGHEECRSIDAVAVQCEGADEGGLEALLENVDERLAVKSIISPSLGGPRSLIEIGFRDREV
jgi:hypothetical protein